MAYYRSPQTYIPDGTQFGGATGEFPPGAYDPYLSRVGGGLEAGPAFRTSRNNLGFGKRRRSSFAYGEPTGGAYLPVPGPLSPGRGAITRGPPADVLGMGSLAVGAVGGHGSPLMGAGVYQQPQAIEAGGYGQPGMRYAGAQQGVQVMHVVNAPMSQVGGGSGARRIFVPPPGYSGVQPLGGQQLGGGMQYVQPGPTYGGGQYGGGQYSGAQYGGAPMQAYGSPQPQVIVPGRGGQQILGGGGMGTGGGVRLV